MKAPTMTIDVEVRVWSRISQRIRRLERARRIVRFLFGPDLNVSEQAELEDLFGYVTLHNVAAPVIAAAREVALTGGGPLSVAHLVSELDKYDERYPEHPR